MYQLYFPQTKETIRCQQFKHSLVRKYSTSHIHQRYPSLLPSDVLISCCAQKKHEVSFQESKVVKPQARITKGKSFPKSPGGRLSWLIPWWTGFTFFEQTTCLGEKKLLEIRLAVSIERSNVEPSRVFTHLYAKFGWKEKSSMSCRWQLDASVQQIPHHSVGVFHGHLSTAPCLKNKFFENP